jgi:BirA family transcriptional regulator, biotin operon repressor / biotin---[acetyl-CoA-carboxylase] ligase
MAFDLSAVEKGILGTEFSRHVMHLPTVDSTNSLAVEAAQAGSRAGVWVADEQTAGRGRSGHAWHSVAGHGLYVSALIAPSLPIRLALLISLATGLAAKHAVAEVTGLEADIRWPNDLLLNGKKCGGILVETAMAPPNTPNSEAILRYAVIGVGINLNQKIFPDDIAQLATSLRIESNTVTWREAMLIALLRSLDAELRLLTVEHEGQLLKRFTDASTWVRGKRVRVEESGGYTGVTAGLDASGFLLVDSDDGIRRTVLSGGVREL